MSPVTLAFEPDPNVWIWRYSTDKQSVYTYNAPPEYISLSDDKNYIEIIGNVLSVMPYDPQISHYQAKIKVGIKIKEKQMWIAYLQQGAYDENNSAVKIKPNPQSDNWHSVLPSTLEEGYGLALFQAFKEHAEAGHYDNEK